MYPMLLYRCVFFATRGQVDEKIIRYYVEYKLKEEARAKFEALPNPALNLQDVNSV